MDSYLTFYLAIILFTFVCVYIHSLSEEMEAEYRCLFSFIIGLTWPIFWFTFIIRVIIKIKNKGGKEE